MVDLAAAAVAPDPLLAAGVLAGRTIVVARAAGVAVGRYGSEVAARCSTLGATVVDLEADPEAEDACAGALRALAGDGVDVLVNDVAGAFERSLAAGGEGTAALRVALDAAWVATRSVANVSLIEPARPGRIVHVAPAAGAGAHPGREAARAACENLARTLSIEWSRYRISITAILPAPTTQAGEVAGLVAFLASPAGEYYSGCAFTLASA